MAALRCCSNDFTEIHLRVERNCCKMEPSIINKKVRSVFLVFCRYNIFLKQDFQQFEFTLFSQLSCHKWYATAYLAYMLGAPLMYMYYNAITLHYRCSDEAQKAKTLGY